MDGVARHGRTGPPAPSVAVAVLLKFKCFPSTRSVILNNEQYLIAIDILLSVDVDTITYNLMYSLIYMDI